ncbi:MAG TPA: hypothetical protein VFF86_00300 [Candidatus Methylomirabilis sp.]|nr:hypothetical protein [Candidatus Methylomirabilis sp.]
MFATVAARLLPFAARFTLTFLLLLVLWPFVSPLYARTMATAGGKLLDTVSLLPSGSHLEVRDRRVWIFRPVTKVDGSRGLAGVNVLDDATYFNCVLLASLIVATPSLRWSATAQALGLGLALLASLHFADLYVKLKWTAIYPGLRLHGILPEAASPATVKLYEWLYAFFSVIGFGLFPILVWIGVVRLCWPRRGSNARQRHGKRRKANVKEASRQ